jgi:hypothetical protein
MKFNQKLALNSYMLSLFGVQSIEELSRKLKESRLEGVDENGQSFFYHGLTQKLFENPHLSKDKLEEYDANIMRHTEALGRDIKWKYFQYLTLLFAEIYLDRFFDDKEKLLEALNKHLEVFNKELPQKEQIEPFKENELNKLAFWNATGSGKTLLMHINLMQFAHYAKGKMKINKTLLLTPNEGLSAQHLKEFGDSNIDAEIFSKDAQSGFRFSGIEIIEITKLADEDGDKTVAVDSFEDNNLVFIDEGHRGSSGDTWKKNRDKLSVNGFAFEYSATFGQAINAETGKLKKELTQEYAKAILFDYSYKYFYNDGYGKDYTILNIKEDDEATRYSYLVASLLSFYQQVKIYKDNPSLMKPYLIENPLMVFVGGSVNSVRTERGQKVSDVVEILLFINEFIKERAASTKAIGEILSGNSGLLNKRQEDIFINRFAYLSSLNLDAETVFEDMLQHLFNNTNGLLHLDNLKGVDGEIALRLGEGEPFGVINVGDTNKLEKLCEANGLSIAKKEFSESLFAGINHKDSKINLLIGAKKFTEGWSSWRVSTMGLMNVGKKEGSQIIQLFGRGVRLKGKNFSLKRSRAYDQGLESKYQAIETLNIFGIRADYMRQFKEYLEEEGVPTDERVEFILPVIKDERYKKHKLKVLRLAKGKDFKREEKVTLEYESNNRVFKKVILNRYKELDLMEAGTTTAAQITLDEVKLTNEHLSFLDMDKLYFELQRFKNERNWTNLGISKEKIAQLLAKNDWYTLYMPKEKLRIDSFSSLLQKIEEIVISLVKNYAKALYEHKKSEWESQFMEYHELDGDDKNFIDEYKISVEDKETDIIEKLTLMQKLLESGKSDDAEFKKLARSDFKAIHFGRHLYNPLLYKDNKVLSLSISPVQLNDGEKDFIEDLKQYLLVNASEFNDTELFVLRNQSRVGMGFFEAGNFYPDFIMWLIQDNKQYITFIDPKGLRNVDVVNGEKINFYNTIKELETKLGDESIVLNSFIVSTTTFNALSDVQSTLSKKELEDKHILFQKNDKETYIGKIFARIHP